MTHVGLRALLRVSAHATAHDAAEPSPDWRARAACLDEDPELFYPIGAGEAYQPQIDAAKAVCAGCPVRVTCREDAMDTEPMDANHRHGIRGGLTKTERANLARSRYRKAKREAGPINHGTEGGAQAHYRRGEKACPDCLRSDASAHRRREAEQRARKAEAT